MGIQNIPYAKNVIMAGIFTSCSPRSAPKITACNPSEIWKKADMINKEDAILTTSETSENWRGLLVSK